VIVELHILQNFAPSNLNRDDTGQPKACDFGGFRRARISSQCLKRAIREQFNAARVFDDANRAIRTKRLVEHLAERLEGAGRPGEEARTVASAAVKALGLDLDEEGLTEYLVFIGNDEIAAAADVCLARWDALLGVNGDAPKELADALRATLGGRKAVDLALFGRMLANLPIKNVDAAAQVAHAISTNQVDVEFDFYTAIDELNPKDTSGAGMLGTIEFNSACFYRYANVDVRHLAHNLGGDGELAGRALEAFTRASVAAVPTGKQNSMAAHNPPSFVLAVVRRSGLWSLANAFVQPVRPNGGKDLVGGSIDALAAHWRALGKMYGFDALVGGWGVALDGQPTLERVTTVDSFDEVVAGVMGALAATGSEAAA
jgi:CRISPR system Cascade subunit CasC